MFLNGGTASTASHPPCGGSSRQFRSKRFCTERPAEYARLRKSCTANTDTLLKIGHLLNGSRSALKRVLSGVPSQFDDCRRELCAKVGQFATNRETCKLSAEELQRNCRTLGPIRGCPVGMRHRHDSSSSLLLS